jgi:hypothetical protein
MMRWNFTIGSSSSNNQPDKMIAEAFRRNFVTIATKKIAAINAAYEAVAGEHRIWTRTGPWKIPVVVLEVNERLAENSAEVYLRDALMSRPLPQATFTVTQTSVLGGSFSPGGRLAPVEMPMER